MGYKYKMEQYQDMISRLYPYSYDKQEKNKIQTFDCTFQVTDACNLCCTYCYQINKCNHTMPLETAQKFIDILLDNNSLTQQYIDTKSSQAIVLEFIGGEPLLEIELIDQICDYFFEQVIIKNHPWQYNWRINMSSNGTLYFNPEVQQFIKKWNNFFSFSISIDGNKKLHDACRKFPDGSGSYDLAIKAARHYMETYNKNVGSKMTLSPQNIQYTSDAVISLLNENYKEIHLNCIYEKGWDYSHAKVLYEQLKSLSNYILDNDLEDEIDISIFDENNFQPMSIDDNENWCGGNGSMIALDWKGDIYPCLRYMESSLGNTVPPVKIGNIKNGIMYNNICKNCVNKLRSINRITQSTQECISCPIAKGCSWCQAYNYQISNGNFNYRATYICCMHKAISLANCYFWNLYYWKHKEKKRFKLWLSDIECLKIISEDELWILKTLAYPYIIK